MRSDRLLDSLALWTGSWSKLCGSCDIVCNDSHTEVQSYSNWQAAGFAGAVGRQLEPAVRELQDRASAARQALLDHRPLRHAL